MGGWNQILSVRGILSSFKFKYIGSLIFTLKPTKNKHSYLYY